MRRVKSYRRIDTFFTLASFVVFSASMLVVLLFGASIYKKTVETSQEGYQERICLSYIWTKIKSNDAAGRVYTDEFCGLQALYLEEKYEDNTYMTAIYLYDGWVRELFFEAGLELYPEDGMPIMEADALVFEQMEDGLIKAKVNAEQIFIFPRGTV